MIRVLIAAVAAALLVPSVRAEEAARAALDPLIARHAAANDVPEALVRRVIMRESRYNPKAIGRGGTMGLMQIKPATARAIGYRGTPEGLLDPDTNLTYGVRYLAGAYRVAEGDHDRAVAYFARGYYYAAKRKGLLAKTRAPLDLSAAARAD
jgi:soluble lytic murein transglycosylase-like protein